MKAIVVDDDPGVRALVRRLLIKEFGSDVVEADDGVSALNLLRREPVDVVLLDFTMRVMSGLDTLEALRRSPAHANVPVVIMTGHADEVRVRRAVEYRIAGCLVKPFAAATFVATMAPILTRCGAMDPRVRPPVSLDIQRSHRTLVIDQSEDVRLFAAQRLGWLCEVSTADQEFAGMIACLERPVDFCFLGATSTMSSLAAIGQKMRSVPALGHLRLVAMAPPSDLDALSALATFDAVIARSFAADVLERSLGQVLSLRSRARLLFHPDSQWMVDACTGLTNRLCRLLGGDVRADRTPGAPAGQLRTVTASVEIQGTEFACALELHCPFDVALEYCSAMGFADADHVSDEDATRTMGRIVADLGDQIVQLAGAEQMACSRTAPVASARETVAIRPDRPLTARRWLLRGARTVSVLEIAPLVIAR